jgi:hypothetical protein
VPATAFVTWPPVVVFKSEPDAMEEMNRFVVEAVPVESEVVVAPTPVKFWSDEEPVTRRFPVVSAEVVPLPRENASPVINPVLLMENKVVVANADVDEAIAKRFGPENDDDAARSEKRAYGVVVPIPTLPAPSMRKCVAVEEPTTNSGTPEPSAFGFTLN